MDRFEPGDLIEFTVAFLHNGNEFYLVLDEYRVHGLHRWVRVYDLLHGRKDQFAYIEKDLFLAKHRARLHKIACPDA